MNILTAIALTLIMCATNSGTGTGIGGGGGKGANPKITVKTTQHERTTKKGLKAI